MSPHWSALVSDYHEATLVSWVSSSLSQSHEFPLVSSSLSDSNESGSALMSVQ